MNTSRPCTQRGELQEKVRNLLTSNPEKSYTCSEASKILDHSSGAIADAMKRLAQSGRVSLVCENPRRYSISSPEQSPRLSGENWNGKSSGKRVRELKARERQGGYAGLVSFQQRLARMCVVLEDYDIIKDFDPQEVNLWVISDILDDLISLGEWHDRALSVTQHWLVGYGAKEKIAKLRNTAGRTSEEAASALRLADRLERKLGTELT